MTDDHTGTMSELFFLTVHRYATESVKMALEENPSMAMDCAIGYCGRMRSEVCRKQREVEVFGESQEGKQRRSRCSSKQIVLLQICEEFARQLQSLQDKLKYLRHLTIVTRKALVNACAELEPLSQHQQRFQEDGDGENPLVFCDEPMDTIETLTVENRGLMLLVMHSLDKSLQSLLHLREQRGEKKTFMRKHVQCVTFEMTQCNMKVGILLVMIKAAVSIAENRYNYLVCCSENEAGSKLEDDHRIIFPFADGINLDDLPSIRDLDYSIFMEKMGTQLMPMANTVFDVLVRVTASHTRTFPHQLRNSYIRHGILLGFQQLIYLFRPSLAARDCVTFFRDSGYVHNQMLWETMDTGIMQYLFYLTLPPIPTSRIFHINGPIPSKMHLLLMSDDTGNEDDEEGAKGTDDADIIIRKQENETAGNVTTDNLLTEQERVERQNDNASTSEPGTTNEEEVDEENGDHEHNLDGSSSMLQFERYTNLMPELLSRDGTATSQEELNKRLDNVRLRLIAPWNVRDVEQKINATEDWGLFAMISRCVSVIYRRIYQAQPPTTRNGCIILHIHGGGFISMSPYSHESYLRRWAYQCNVPIVSVDYRKSPQHVYPSLVAECYEAYKWVLQNAEHIVGEPLKKIIVTGDSAGGNLSMAICNRAIQDKIRIPDALVLTYPVSFLGQAPSSARVMALLDPLVNHGFLKMCMKCYAGDASDDIRTNAYLSPAVTPPEILSQYPPVYISVGSLDPLLDDSVHMAKRIHKYNGGRVALEIYDGLAHGYLNMVGLVPGGTTAVQNISHWMNKFFDFDEFISRQPADEVPVGCPE